MWGTSWIVEGLVNFKKYENYNYGKNSPYNLEIHIEDFTDEII